MVVRFLPQVLGAVLLAWCLAVALSSRQSARALPHDPMPELEAEFARYARYLPPSGDIGYLEQYKSDGTDLPIRMHYAAQYALVPRVIVGRTGPEFLIVAHGTADPDGDPRLDGYVPIETFANGDRLFRRRSR
jgi:hypothetical protein